MEDGDIDSVDRLDAVKEETDRNHATRGRAGTNHWDGPGGDDGRAGIIHKLL